MKVALYLRKSTDEQAESNETQRDNAERWCAKRGWTVVAQFADSGISRTDFAPNRRKGWFEMQERAAAGDFEAVIVRDVSRIGGNIGRALVFVEDLIASGVRLFQYASGEEINSANALQCVTLALALFGAQGEVEAIRTRTREALLTRARKGLVAGGVVYGYRNAPAPDGSKSKVREVLVEQADVVRDIFQRYATGDGLRTIAKSLNARKVPSPRAGRRGLGTWTPSALHAIVRRPLYAGRIEWGATHKDHKGYAKHRTETHACERVIVDAPDLRIVDAEIWERVQIRTAAAPKRKSPGKPAQHMLSGVLRCADCGGPLTVANGRAGKTPILVYTCQRRRDRGTCNASLRRPVEVVDRIVMDWVRQHVLTPTIVKLVVGMIREELAGDHARRAGDEKRIETDIKQLRHQIDKLLEAVPDADVDARTALLRGVSERQARLTSLEVELRTARTLPGAMELDLRRIERQATERFATLASVGADNPREARLLLGQLFPDGLKATAIQTETGKQMAIDGAATIGAHLFVNQASPAGQSPFASAEFVENLPRLVA